MLGNGVVYVFVHGADGLPTLARTEKCPGTEAPGPLFPSAAGWHPQEEHLVSPEPTILAQTCPSANCEPARLRPGTHP
jgi:hypothetical protein